MKLDDVIREFVESYESRDPDYTPTDHERALIEDAINGFLHDFLKQIYSGRKPYRARYPREAPVPKPLEDAAAAALDRMDARGAEDPIQWASVLAVKLVRYED